VNGYTMTVLDADSRRVAAVKIVPPARTASGGSMVVPPTAT
jgi:hypothetical protein